MDIRTVYNKALASAKLNKARKKLNRSTYKKTIMHAALEKRQKKGGTDVPPFYLKFDLLQLIGQHKITNVISDLVECT